MLSRSHQPCSSIAQPRDSNGPRERSFLQLLHNPGFLTEATCREGWWPLSATIAPPSGGFPAPNTPSIIMLIIIKESIVLEQTSLNFQSMSESSPSRFLCVVPLSKDILACTCGGCRWVFRIKETDIATGQAAFNAHRCEDFPREQETHLQRSVA